MELRREFQLVIGILVGLQVVTAFAAIGLLSRMSPAIERILQENVYSLEAAEEMLAVLALAGGAPAEPPLRQRFERALEDARRNVTESEEIAVIEALEREAPRALEGDGEAIAAAIRALEELVEINRRAMRRIDEEARRLGTAGAWAAVILALIGFGTSLLVVRRMRRRLLAPLGELFETLEASRRGDRFRRCRVSAAPVELERILVAVNQILERGEVERSRKQEEGRERERERALVRHLLDERARPSFVVDRRGELVAANEKGHALLDGERGDALRDVLRSVPSGEDGTVASVAVREGELWVAEIDPKRIGVDAKRKK